MRSVKSIFHRFVHVVLEVDLIERGLLHDANELLLADFTVAVAISLINHLLEFLISHVLSKLLGHTLEILE